MQRVQEPNATVGTDLARDQNSALSLLRKYEAFEIELVVLEAQLQVLFEDISRLQKCYPNNKVYLQHQQQVVVQAWNGLKERIELRKDQLQASVDSQNFSLNFEKIFFLYYYIICELVPKYLLFSKR